MKKQESNWEPLAQKGNDFSAWELADLSEDEQEFSQGLADV